MRSSFVRAKSSALWNCRQDTTWWKSCRSTYVPWNSLHWTGKVNLVGSKSGRVACVRTAHQTISSRLGITKEGSVGCVRWGFRSISDSRFANPRNMANQNSLPAAPRRQIPKRSFRVLIIGRANAGKTSILQRICDTTESPVVYRRFYYSEGGYDLDTVSIPTVL